MRLASMLHARRRDAVADEGGFALIAVLAVIAFTGITIAALLGMMITTMRVTSNQERTARERRAADGAIENAIEKMRTSQCDPAAQPFLADQTVSGVEVDVSCSSTLAGGSSTDQVRLVGVDGYDGAYRAWNLDCATNAAAAGCLPWSAAGTSPGSATPADVSLVHSGAEPLRFDSGITVRRGAAVLRNPTTGSPAIESGGEYNQGRPGIAGTGPTDCGILSGTPGGGAGLVRDSSGTPGCGVAAAANLTADSAANLSGLVAPTAPVTIPSCTGPVVTFQPGNYNALQTAAVSALTGGGTCTGRTFYFSPGIYSFQGNQLRFSDPASFYVFGAPTSAWNTSTGVQANPALTANGSAALCEPTASGSTLVVAGWTEIVHTGGRVAICPNRPASDPGNPHPAIFQQTSVPNGVTVSIARTGLATPITHPFTCRGQNFFLGYTYPDAADINDYGECRPVRRYTLNLSTSGAAQVDSLRVMLTGRESTPNNLVSERRSRFTVYPATGGVICTTGWVTGMPNGGITSSFDLKRSGGTCQSGPAFNQDRLAGGRIVVEHSMLRALFGVDPLLTISGASVEVNAHSGRVQRPADVTSTQWTNPGAVAVADTTRATAIMPCSAGVCEVADPGGTRTPSQPFSHALTLGNFQFPNLLNTATPGLVPAVTSLRAVIKVAPSAGPLPPPADGIILLPTSVFVELRSPTGHRCVVQGQGMNSDQEIAIDLLDVNLETAAGPGCNSMPFSSANDLAGITMTVRFDTPCVQDYSAPHYGAICLRNGTNIFQLRPPGIEQVQLTATTDTYTATSTSSIVSNATGGATSTSFNVFGITWMPLTDLDIAWRGPATTTPLFANDLVLNGLGSRMDPGAAMGTVCCNPPTSRTLEFTASIAGVDRMVARVHFDDSIQVVPGRAQVDVLRWLNCGGACASVLAESDTRPGP